MLASVRNHPTTLWLRKHFGTILVVTPIVTGIWAIWWTFEQDRQFNIAWADKDDEWNAAILGKLDELITGQSRIETTLAVHGAHLDGIEHGQDGAKQQLDRAALAAGTARAEQVRAIRELRAAVAYITGLLQRPQH